MSMRPATRLIVLSDTHIDRLEQLPGKIVDAICSADLVIHAGDFTCLQLLKELIQLKDVRAVHGNMDSQELKAVLPAKEIVEVAGQRIGITHGSGTPWGIEERVKKVFGSDQIDVVVYGHSHRPQNKVINNVPFFNPGRSAYSFGILTIDGKARGEIVSSQ